MRRLYITIIAISGILIISLAGHRFFFSEKPSFELVEVERGSVIQEVLATGQIKRGEQINLGFKNSGKIEKIYVKVGDNVVTGQVLAQMNKDQLNIQLQEAQALLAVAQANLDRLIAGASQEEIRIAQSGVENARVSLSLARKNLQDGYTNSQTVLEDCYLKAEDAKNTVVLIYKSHFEVSALIRENKESIEALVSEIRSSYEKVQKEPTNENIESSFPEVKANLNEISIKLSDIRGKLENPSYYHYTSSTEKALLDTKRINVNLAISSLNAIEQSISSLKSALTLAQGQLRLAEDNLALVTAKPREEDISLYQAQLNQARARVFLLQSQSEEAVLRSPVEGQISALNKREGETFQTMMDKVIISLVPKDPFQVEADIPEVDIEKIEVGNSVKITLDAFGEKEFSGKVIEINPAESVIQSVVYYKIKTSLETKEDKIKPGMTANVTIIAQERKDVLILPQRAILSREGKSIVRLPSGKDFKEVEIETGLKGADGNIEVISGLTEGEKVILRIKEK